VVFDDQFTTVPHMRNLTVPPNWEQLVQHSRELVTTEQFDLTKTWFEGENDITVDTILQPLNENDSFANLQETIDRSQADTVPHEAGTMANEGDPNTLSFKNHRWLDEVEQQTVLPDTTTVSKGDDKLRMPELVNLEESGLRRSTRIATQKRGIKRSVLTTLFCFGATLASPIASAEAGMKVDLTTAQSDAYQFEQVNEHFDGTCNDIMHHVYTAAKEANESYTFKEMLHII